MRGHPVRRSVGGFPVPDLALSGLVLLIAVASILAGKPDEGPLAVTLPLGVLLALAVAGRTRDPVLAAGVATAAGLLQTAFASSPGSLWALAVYLVLTYSVAAERDEGLAAVGGAVIVGGQALQEWFDRGTDYVFIVLVFGGAWLLGRGIRQWRERATYAETHQQDLARRPWRRSGSASPASCTTSSPTRCRDRGAGRCGRPRWARDPDEAGERAARRSRPPAARR